MQPLFSFAKEKPFTLASHMQPQQVGKKQPVTASPKDGYICCHHNHLIAKNQWWSPRQGCSSLFLEQQPSYSASPSIDFALHTTHKYFVPLWVQSHLTPTSLYACTWPGKHTRYLTTFKSRRLFWEHQCPFVIAPPCFWAFTALQVQLMGPTMSWWALKSQSPFFDPHFGSMGI